jgi:hypothetical protein
VIVSDPVSRARTAPPGRSILPPAASAPSGAATRFADALQATRRASGDRDAGPLEGALRGAVASIARGERLVEGVVQAARRGATFSNEQLIAIQAGVYRYTQELELAGKLVDKATGAVRQTLQSQQ